jgi:hypothetical protein
MSFRGFGGVLRARRTAASRRLAIWFGERSGLCGGMSKPQMTCIFCSGTPVSKEHIWSEWTRQLIGRSTADRHLNIVSTPAGAIKGVRRVNGGLDTAKLRVVCKDSCNGGWMSRLDAAVKHSASRLISGEAVHLDEASQTMIARWLIMKMMVTEHEKGMTVVSTDGDRNRIMNGEWPINHDWKIWIARQAVGTPSRGYARHLVSPHGAARRLGEPKSDSDHIFKHAQQFVFRIGRLVAISTTSNQPFNPTLESSGHAVVQLFPVTASIRWPPLADIDDRSVRVLEVWPSALDRVS